MFRKSLIPALVLVCATAASALAGGTEPPAENLASKRRMVVLDLTEDTSVAGRGPLASVALTDALRKTWLWRVSTRQETNKVLAGSPIDSLYYQTPDDIRAVGQRLGAAYVVHGRLGPMKLSAAPAGALPQIDPIGFDDDDRAARRDGFLSSRPGDVQIVEHADAETGGHVEASLRVSIGIYDVETGRTVLEHFYDERGTFGGDSESIIFEKLFKSAVEKLTGRLRAATNMTDGLILL